MIGLLDAAEIVEEFDELGLGFAGETSGLHVWGGVKDFAVVLSQHHVWSTWDENEWAKRQDIFIETKEQLKAAIIGELGLRVEFYQKLIEQMKGDRNESN
jgi:hypothetical protein